MSEKITFKQLIDQISAETDKSYDQTNSFVHELVQIIESGLKENGSVSISGFGKFELRWMDERPGRNPQTGEEITIPGQNKVVFKPYKALRDPVNKPYAKMKPQILGSEKSGDKSEEPKQTEPGENVSGDEFLVERSRPDSPKSKQPVAKISKEEIAESVQEAGSFKWSYAAASVIALFVLFALFFFMMRSQPAEESATIQPYTQQPTVIDADPTAHADVTDRDNGAAPAVSEESEPSATPEFIDHQVQSGESLWTIAERELGDPYLWPLIFEQNLELISNPNRLTAGINLTIPSVQNPEELTDSENESVAMGYLAVYNWAQNSSPDQAKFFLWAAGSFSPEILERESDRINSQDLAFATRR